MQPTSSLQEALTAALPLGLRCRYNYIRTPAKSCDALFSPLPDQAPEKTRLTSHFLGVSLLDRRTLENGSEAEIPVMVLAVEVLGYTTKRITTLFVSKADSTGFTANNERLPIKVVCSTFLDWLASNEVQAHPNRKVVVSLFARAQSQYLFPGSAEYSGKHVLDDRGLVKWWAKVLDPLLERSSPEDQKPTLNAYITIPGYSATDLRPYFPLNSRMSWQAGDPLHELARTRGLSESAPPRCLLPRFPDDPKARFMMDLDEEVGLMDDSTKHSSPSKRRNGNWKAIRGLERFWEAMEFRQECSSGRIVGFLWLVVSPKALEGGEVVGESRESFASNSREDTPTPVGSSKPNTRSAIKSRPRRSESRSKPLSGPIIARKPRIKSVSGTRSTASPSRGTGWSAPENGIIVSKEGYDAVMQTLLHLDFAKRNLAESGTKKWIAEAANACGMRGKVSGVLVEGTAPRPAAVDKPTGASQVNDLGGMIRKKRKTVDDVKCTDREGEQPSKEEAKAEVNVLSAGLVRKKPKKETT